jgi:hypothetical protein
MDVRRRHPRRWVHGAAGEELVAAALAQRCDPHVRVLHDRSMPRSRANIDHVAIAPTGVWVVDTKRYTGRIEVVKPLLGRARLEVAGRDRTKLVDGLAKQVEAVAGLVDEIAPGTAVHGAFLNAAGPMRPDAIAALADALGARLKPA